MLRLFFKKTTNVLCGPTSSARTCGVEAWPPPRVLRQTHEGSWRKGWNKWKIEIFQSILVLKKVGFLWGLFVPLFLLKKNLLIDKKRVEIFHTLSKSLFTNFSIFVEYFSHLFSFQVRTFLSGFAVYQGGRTPCGRGPPSSWPWSSPRTTPASPQSAGFYW